MSDKTNQRFLVLPRSQTSGKARRVTTRHIIASAGSNITNSTHRAVEHHILPAAPASAYIHAYTHQNHIRTTSATQVRDRSREGRNRSNAAEQRIRSIQIIDPPLYISLGIQSIEDADSFTVWTVQCSEHDTPVQTEFFWMKL